MRWSDPAFLLAVGLGGAAVSALGTAWALGHARRHGLIDIPDDRRSHHVETPRGGGIGVVIACLACLIAMAVADSANSFWLFMAAGLVLVAGIGWLDDHSDLAAWPRLVVHALAAGLLAIALYWQGASVLICALSFLLAMGLTNAWNFMDGINGLAAGQTVLCGLGFALLPGFMAPVLGIVLAGSCLGFLPFNFPHARIFLGDVGSGALGYLVAALIAIGFTTSTSANWPLLLLAPLAMLADSSLTLALRMRRGERWWQAHAQHAYQRWSRSVGHAKVTLVYALWTMTMIAVMLSVWGREDNMGLVVFLACVATATLGWWWLQRQYAR